MSTEAGQQQSGGDASREAILEAVKSAVAQDNVLLMNDKGEIAAPPEQAEIEAAGEPEAEPAEAEAAAEGETPAAAGEAQEEADEVAALLEEFRKKKGDVATKATEIEVREKEAKARIDKMHADAEKAIQDKIAAALDLLSTDPRRAAQKYGVDPDKYVLRQAEDEAPEVKLRNELNEIVKKQNEVIETLRAERQQESTQREEQVKAQRAANLQRMRDEYAASAKPETHPYVASLWTKDELLQHTDALIGELVQARQVTGKSVNLSDAQLLERMERKAREEAPKTLEAMRAKVKALESLVAKQQNAAKTAAVPPKKGMNGAVEAETKGKPPAAAPVDPEKAERERVLAELKRLRAK